MNRITIDFVMLVSLLLSLHQRERLHLRPPNPEPPPPVCCQHFGHADFPSHRHRMRKLFG